MTTAHAVTGALGYTGKYITRRLLDGGARVVSLTGHPDRPNPFDSPIESRPYSFDDPGALARSLDGMDTLFNTYWIRVAYKGMTHDRAAENLRILFQAAKRAGVRRVVHVSITNPSADSMLPYFRGKAIVEGHLRESGLSHAILRPALIFGREDILLNNIAWMLRRFPVFPIPGSGDYRVQPIYVEDMADLAVKMSSRHDDATVDAVGPETFSYEDLTRLIMREIGANRPLLHVSPSLAMLGARLTGALVRDIVLSRDEIHGLMNDLLISKSSDSPPGKTRLTDWLAQNAANLGSAYANELDRHYR